MSDTGMQEIMDIENIARNELRNSATIYEKTILAEHPAEWHVALLNMRDAVNRQVENWKSRLKEKYRLFEQGECPHEEVIELQAAYDDWRPGALHFRSLVEARARQVKLLRQKQYEQLRVLQNAIKQHYLDSLVRDEEGTFLEPTPADRRLWSVLNLDPENYDNISSSPPHNNNNNNPHTLVA